MNDKKSIHRIVPNSSLGRPSNWFLLRDDNINDDSIFDIIEIIDFFLERRLCFFCFMNAPFSVLLDSISANYSNYC